MSITNPTQLVAEFKKSGEFDRLRRELLAQFRNDESIGSFTARVQDIVQQRLNDDTRLQYLGPDAVHAELMQEMDRFPLVERAVADLPTLSDPAFSAGIRKSITNLLNTPRQGDAGRVVGKRAELDANTVESDSAESDSSDEEDANAARQPIPTAPLAVEQQGDQPDQNAEGSAAVHKLTNGVEKPGTSDVPLVNGHISPVRPEDQAGEASPPPMVVDS
ncbi:hypothetical protein M0805_000778 [Coniferiporia weirii]|nr:hypothetical protein M0805_000778 [Coniferiporia weirii]